MKTFFPPSLPPSTARCYTGFSKDDKEKKKPIPEGKALEEWKELLEKRFPQPNSGGKPFVLQIVDMCREENNMVAIHVPLEALFTTSTARSWLIWRPRWHGPRIQ